MQQNVEYSDQIGQTIEGSKGSGGEQKLMLNLLKAHEIDDEDKCPLVHLQQIIGELFHVCA